MEPDHFDIRRQRVTNMIKTMKRKSVYEDQTELVRQCLEIIQMDELSQHSLLWNEYEVWVFDTALIYLLDMALDKQELRSDSMHCLRHLISKIQISHKRIIESGVMLNLVKIAIFETRTDITENVTSCLDVLFEIPASTSSSSIIDYLETADFKELTPGGITSLTTILNSFTKHSFRNNPYINGILRICHRLLTLENVDLLIIVAGILKTIADAYVDGKEIFIEHSEWFELFYKNMMHRNLSVQKAFADALLSVCNRYPEVVSIKIKEKFFTYWRRNIVALGLSTHPKKLTIDECRAYGIEQNCIFELNRGPDNQMIFDKIYKFQALEDGYHEIYRGLLHSVIQLLNQSRMVRDNWGTLGLYMGGHMTVFEDLNEMVTETGIVNVLHENKAQNTETSPVNFMELFIKACYALN